MSYLIILANTYFPLQPERNQFNALSSNQDYSENTGVETIIFMGIWYNYATNCYAIWLNCIFLSYNVIQTEYHYFSGVQHNPFAFFFLLIRDMSLFSHTTLYFPSPSFFLSSFRLIVSRRFYYSPTIIQ